MGSFPYFNLMVTRINQASEGLQRRMRIWRYVICAMTVVCRPVLAQDQGWTTDLSGEWRFRIGDHKEYADPLLNDRLWEAIQTPSRWEDAGFPGYDGYAWYRKRVTIPISWQGRNIVLNLGRIDDVDQVFLNGSYIAGSGLFPPIFRTAVELRREYVLPPHLIHWNQENVIAVRVYDERFSGGILEGAVTLSAREERLQLLIDLAGEWAFAVGDDMKRKNSEYDDHVWKRILVPSYWEMQGFPNYDGIAWYRKTIVLPEELAEQPLLLILGYINDLDEVYWNGELIGRTGKFPSLNNSVHIYTNQFIARAYAIDPGLVRAHVKTTIAVRVYDYGRWGGIYKGFIGITSAEHWLRYANQKSTSRQ